MVVLRESPWYQEAVQQGIQQGIAQGVQQGALIQLLRLLQLRFGETPPEIEAALGGLSLEELENLLAVALTAKSLEEFGQQLPR